MINRIFIFAFIIFAALPVYSKEVKHSPELEQRIAEYESNLNSVEMYVQKSCKDVEKRNGSGYVFYDEKGKCNILEGSTKNAPVQVQMYQGPFLYFNNY